MEFYTEEEKQSNAVSRKGISYAKIYLWFGLGILITGIVGFGLPYILQAIYGTNNESMVSCYTILVVASAIASIVLSLVINLRFMKEKSTASIICFTLYSVAFGILLSSALSFVGLETSLYAFLITGGVMFLMGIFGALLKNRIKNIYLVILSLLFSSLIISLVNLFLFNEMLYWISTFAMLAISLLFVGNLPLIKSKLNLSKVFLSIEFTFKYGLNSSTLHSSLEL